MLARLPRKSALLLLALAVAAAAPVARADKAREVRKKSFELLNEGVAAYRRGEFALAVAKLEATSAVALSSFRAYFFLGLARIGVRDYAGAIEALDVALDLDPNHLQSLVALGDAQLKLGDVDEARAAYVRALKLRPGYALALDGVARGYESQAQLDEAVERYLAAIASDRGYAPAYTHLGDLYLRQGRFQEAVRLLEEAVKIRPDYAPGMNRLALAYGRLGMAGEAVATIARAIVLEPESPEHRVTLGELQLDQGLVDDAERSFGEALGLAPAMPEARLGMAEIARRRGLWDEALAVADSALAGEHLDPLNAHRLTEFRAAVESEKERVLALEAAVAAGGATPEELGGLAESYAGRGLWQEAAELQGRAAETAEQRERWAYYLFRSGSFRDAHRIYADLSRDGDTGLLLDAGVTLARLGDDPAALDSFDRILAREPAHRLARLYRGNALLRLGRVDEAARTYKAFLDQDDRGEVAERVRRILKQIAPALLPPEDASPVPEAPPAPAEDEPA